MSESRRQARPSVSIGQRDVGLVNLRGDPTGQAGFGAAVEQVTGLALPESANRFTQNDAMRIQWVGPDDWFVVGEAGSQESLCQRLSGALHGMHHAITDVSGGYRQIRIAGAAARELLAQGCPLDLHPRVFSVGQCAGSVFFKAQIYLAMTSDTPAFELLVRRSFVDYFWQLVDACALGYDVHRSIQCA